MHSRLTVKLELVDLFVTECDTDKHTHIKAKRRLNISLTHYFIKKSMLNEYFTAQMYRI